MWVVRASGSRWVRVALNAPLQVHYLLPQCCVASTTHAPGTSAVAATRPHTHTHHLQSQTRCLSSTHRITPSARHVATHTVSVHVHKPTTQCALTHTPAASCRHQRQRTTLPSRHCVHLRHVATQSPTASLVLTHVNNTATGQLPQAANRANPHAKHLPTRQQSLSRCHASTSSTHTAPVSHAVAVSYHCIVSVPVHTPTVTGCNQQSTTVTTIITPRRRRNNCTLITTPRRADTRCHRCCGCCFNNTRNTIYMWPLADGFISHIFSNFSCRLLLKLVMNREQWRRTTRCIYLGNRISEAPYCVVALNTAAGCVGEVISYR